MARRSSRPSLYEVAQQRLDRAGQGVDQPDDAAVPSLPPSRITPGSSVRLPFGFIIVGVVVVIGTVIGAWWIGRGAGVQEVQRDLRAAGQGRVGLDPLARPQPLGVIQEPPPAPVSPTPAGAEPEPPPVRAAALPQAPEGDPRIPGQWYFVLAETRRGGAEEIAAFCRQEGLDVAVVSGHNARLAKVIALPGLSSARATDPAFQELDASIASVGRRWRESGRRTSFADRYLQLKGDTP